MCLASVANNKSPSTLYYCNLLGKSYLYTYGKLKEGKSPNLPKNMGVPREERGGRVDQTLVAVDVGIELVIAIRNAHCAHTHTLSYPYFLKLIFISVFLCKH
jgi:hypothetical protein